LNPKNGEKKGENKARRKSSVKRVKRFTHEKTETKARLLKRAGTEAINDLEGIT
jgi:hypothetical protein